jgi:hypothetical protein
LFIDWSLPKPIGILSIPTEPLAKAATFPC